MVQELQGDLRHMMHLRHQTAEYQLAIYPSNGAQYVRHRDAFPDDGSEDHQRRVRHLHPCTRIGLLVCPLAHQESSVCMPGESAYRLGFTTLAGMLQRIIPSRE